MMKSIEDGLADLAVEFRKLGAVLKADAAVEATWERYIRYIVPRHSCTHDLWRSWRAPHHPRFSGEPTNEEMQRMLDARTAVYVMGNVRETEKLHDLADL